MAGLAALVAGLGLGLARAVTRDMALFTAFVANHQKDGPSVLSSIQRVRAGRASHHEAMSARITSASAIHTRHKPSSTIAPSR
ncbi:hypothetical protein FA15DRAFT_675378 [Coprinopsis marcescibilis]|uniref:HIG1 domain-containing protein n=1 Tax=Coprinopsis marcescibilis TaxID=230819 RepID=A0A5C3KEG7_COPMA|nr:hypothetical protein FA15DRAFT_675378 [Coprinopsis marcescibilis]